MDNSASELAALKQQQEKSKRPSTVIFDARSLIAATANRARGGGFENNKYYHCRIVFLQMENIHAVKSSWKKCKKLIETFNNNLSNASHKDNVPGPQGPNTGFYTDWEKTGWVMHVQRLLYGAVRIVDELSAGASCMIHCSDGWDRTSQLTSTAMMLIDPHFRTVKGFCMLVEKEWCVPGHKFAERSGHQVEGKMGQSKFKEGLGNEMDDTDSTGITKHTKTGSGMEPSPIFLQWLDAVFQLVNQYPTAFEFSAYCLEWIAIHVYSCRFGTFICNFDKERIGEGVKDRTVSVWTELLRLVGLERTTRDYKLLNSFYVPVKKGQPYVLRPTCNGKRMALWESFYLRHDVEHNYHNHCYGQLVTSLPQNAAPGDDSDEAEEVGTHAASIRQQLGDTLTSEDLAGTSKSTSSNHDVRDSELAVLKKKLEVAEYEIKMLTEQLQEKQREEATAFKATAAGTSPTGEGKPAPQQDGSPPPSLVNSQSKAAESPSSSAPPSNSASGTPSPRKPQEEQLRYFDPNEEVPETW